MEGGEAVFSFTLRQEKGESTQGKRSSYTWPKRKKKNPTQKGGKGKKIGNW